jgi:hypothetical protein
MHTCIGTTLKPEWENDEDDKNERPTGHGQELLYTWSLGQLDEMALHIRSRDGFWYILIS